MAIVTIDDKPFAQGTPVSVTGLRGPLFFAGARRDERTGEEWLEVFNLANDRLVVPPEAAISAR
jgi:hypothetical protein